MLILKKINNQFILNILKFSAFAVFASRAFHYLKKGAPYRALLWHEERMSGFYDWLGMGYEAFVTEEKYDHLINTISFWNGILYIICAIAVLFINFKSKKILNYIIGLGGISLMFLYYLIALDKFEAYAMFFEHSIQMGVPFATIWYANKQNNKTIIWFLAILTAITFTCHGLYAMGDFYRLPGNFISMTKTILGTSDKVTVIFLYTAGILDLILAMCIFIPKIRKPFLLYAAFWGTITAFARIVYGLHFGTELYIWKMYLYETTVRFGHGLVPLAAFFIAYKENGQLLKG